MSEFDIQLVLAKKGNIDSMGYVADVYHAGIVDGTTSDRHSIFKAKYWYLRVINNGGKRMADYAVKRLEELNVYLEKVYKNGMGI